MSDPCLTARIAAALNRIPEIDVAFLFGSAAHGALTPDSDIDVAVAGPTILSAFQKREIVEALATTVGRPIDLIDLRTAGGEILAQALTRGTRLLCRDTDLYAACIARMWEQQADILPIYRGAMRRKLEAFADGQ